MIVPLFVGREKSVKALEEVMKDDKQILLIAQKNASQDDPGPTTSTPSHARHRAAAPELPDDTVKVAGRGRPAREDRGLHRQARVLRGQRRRHGRVGGRIGRTAAAARTVVSEFENYVKLNKKVPPEVVVSINKIEEPAKLADTISAHLALKVAEKQQLLELDSVSKRLERHPRPDGGEIGVLRSREDPQPRQAPDGEDAARVHLNEQMKAIQKELARRDGRDEISEMEKRIKKTRLSKEAREKANGELKKLRTMSPMSAEATVVRNYLDWLLSIRGASRPRSSRT